MSVATLAVNLVAAALVAYCLMADAGNVPGRITIGGSVLFAGLVFISNFWGEEPSDSLPFQLFSLVGLCIVSYVVYSSGIHA